MHVAIDPNYPVLVEDLWVVATIANNLANIEGPDAEDASVLVIRYDESQQLAPGHTWSFGYEDNYGDHSNLHSVTALNFPRTGGIEYVDLVTA